jgi:hypothetical protein
LKKIVMARLLGTLAVVFSTVSVLAWALLSFAWPNSPVDIHVRWKPEVTAAQRGEMERQFQLTAGEFLDGTTWRYQLADTATANIRALVQDPRVDDTEHLNRVRYRPEFGQDRARQVIAYSLALGGIGAVALLVVVAVRRYTPSRGGH